MAFNKAKALQEADKLVVQGKISQAIKQYESIHQKDPSDVGLLNTIGDLFVRDKNVPEALKCFHKLAETFSQEGFTVKAIAIYKKISKLDPNAVEVLLKMGELYILQGLSREAREQYAQAADYYKKKNLNDKALEALRKMVGLDPENASHRARLGEFCEQLGKKSDAAQAYAEAAEIALRRGDAASAEPIIQRAAGLDPKNAQAQFLRARLALRKNKPQEAENIINSLPELQSNPEAQQVLLEVYLALQKLDAAEKLVVDVFRAKAGDFSPVASFANLCLAKGNPDAALKPLAVLADSLIEAKHTAPLMESLRQIWQKTPRHIPSLELIYKVCDKTADEFTLPEILQALGDAYFAAGNLGKAEWAFQRLVSREPENEAYKGLLKQVLIKAGKALEAKPSDFAQEVALAPEAEAPAAPSAAGVSEEEAAKVKEALDNSDLYARYGLVEKAVAELEKALATYPDQVDIHQRILEVCQKGSPQRAAQAATALAKIYAQRGDKATCEKYERIARAGGAAPAEKFEIPMVPVEQAAAPEAPAPAAPQVAEFDLSAELAAPPAEEAPAAGPVEIPVDLGVAATQASEAPAPAQEFDLSAGFETPSAAAEAPAEAPAFNSEEARVEINFYLQQGFVDEARNAVQALEEKYPGSSVVAELRELVEQHAAPAPLIEAVPEATPAPEAAKVELPAASLEPAAAEPPVTFEEIPAAEPSPPPPAPAAAPPIPEPAPAAAGGGLLGSLVGDLEASLAGIEEKAPASAAAPPSPPAPDTPTVRGPASPLSGLLEELGEGPGAQAPAEDPQTHYDLGVAFREMNLLDEAIGEFQKVVKGASKGQYPPNFLQACTLLGICFMDKQMPAIAAKWYGRALETPGLDEEATLALHYDLGMAYEKAGDTKTALEKFSEVYAQNIDYRDVAEKIRLLQQQKS